MAKTETAQCRTCTYLDVPLDGGGRRRVQNKGYRCLAPEPPVPPLPACITKAYGFHWPPSRRHMSPDEGEGCPAYVRREG